MKFDFFQGIFQVVAVKAILQGMEKDVLCQEVLVDGRINLLKEMLGLVGLMKITHY